MTILGYVRLYLAGIPAPEVLNTDHIAKARWQLALCNRFAGGYDPNNYRFITGKLMDNLGFLEDMTTALVAVTVACILFILYHRSVWNKKKYEFAISEKVSTVCFVLGMPVTMILFYMMLLR